MTETDKSGKTVKIEVRYRIMTVLWVSFLVTMLVFALVAFLIQPPEVAAGGDNTTLVTVLFAMGISTVIASFVVKKIFLTRAANEQRVEMVQTGLIVALVLCEMAGIFGLLAHFATHHPYSYLLFAVGALGMLLHFPRRAHLLAASYRG